MQRRPFQQRGPHPSLSSTTSKDCSDEKKVHAEPLCALGGRSYRKRPCAERDDDDKGEAIPQTKCGNGVGGVFSVQGSIASTVYVTLFLLPQEFF